MDPTFVRGFKGVNEALEAYEENRLNPQGSRPYSPTAIYGLLLEFNAQDYRRIWKRLSDVTIEYEEQISF